MTRTICCTMIAMMTIATCIGQATLQRTFGGFANDWGRGLTQGPDGSLYMCGYTQSFLVGTSNGDAMLLKLDTDADLLWGKSYTSANVTGFSAIQAGRGGELLAVGKNGSPGDGMAVLLDTAGVLLWAWAANNMGNIESSDTTLDGGWYLFGSTDAGNTDLQLHRLDSTGTLVWSFAFGSGYDEEGWRVRTTPDGGAILAGATLATGPYQDGLLVKVDAAGALEWSKVYSTPGLERFYDVIADAGGGYLVVGESAVLPGTPWNCVLRVNAVGDTLWTRKYVSLSESHARSVVRSANGFIVLFEGSYSIDALVLAEIDTLGTMNWIQRYGSGDLNDAEALITLADGRLGIAASTFLEWGVGGEDPLVVLTEADGTVTGCNTGIPLPIATSIAFTLTNTGATVTSGSLSPLTLLHSSCLPLTEDHCNSLPGGLLGNVLPAFELFPNPTSGDVQVDGCAPGDVVRVFSSLGVLQTVLYITSPGIHSIPIERASGVYFVRVERNALMLDAVPVVRLE